MGGREDGWGRGEEGGEVCAVDDGDGGGAGGRRGGGGERGGAEEWWVKGTGWNGMEL